MKCFDFHRPTSSKVWLIWIFMVGPLISQEVDLNALVEGSRVAIKAKNWQQALDFNTRAAGLYEKSQALKSYGPQFGAVFYHKGICEMKLKRWKEAMQSFETCYRDFPNQGTAGENSNPFEKMALLKWGEAAMGAGLWEMAISRFSKFSEERDSDRDAFPMGSFQVNTAICHYKLGRIAQGSESLEIAIRNKAVFPTPETGIIAGFQSLVETVVAQRDEQALLDFIGKNRGELLVHPATMHRYAQVFLKLASDAIDAKMNRAAMALYQFVPSTDEAIDDVRARLKSLGVAEEISDGGNVFSREELEEELGTLEAQRRGKQAPEMMKLAAVAFLHESAGNTPGALAAYRQLETFYPNAEKREDNLFNLIRLSTLVGPADDTPALVTTFSELFPDSPLLPEMKRLLLSSLFGKGDYEACIGAARPALETLKPGTPDHEICLYLLAASYFQTGQYDRAKEPLDRHMEIYPTGDRALSAAFLQASNAWRLGSERTISLFEAFVKNHPNARDNPFLPAALYAIAASQVAEKKPAAAIPVIDRILLEFPASEVAGQTHNLKGSIEQAGGKPAAAEKEFLKALEISVSRSDRATAGDALAALVDLLERGFHGKRPKEAVAFAERFWKDFSDGSPHRNRVAMTAISAYGTIGKADAGMNRLSSAMVETAKNPSSGNLREIVDCYTSVYLKTHRPEELAKHYAQFPGIDPANRSAWAMLRMAVIVAYESLIAKAPGASEKQAATGEVKVLFQRFKTDFPIKDLDSRDLLRLGDFLHLKTSAPREALAYYDEVIGRNEPALRFAALLGRGDVLGRSSIPADINAGIADFQAVHDKSGDRAERDYAFFRLIGLLESSGRHQEAADATTRYLDRERSGFLDFIPQVEWQLAKAREGLAQGDEAIATYARIGASHRDEIAISAPAMLRWMQLAWDRNPQPADRRRTCMVIETFLAETREISRNAAQPWDEIQRLVGDYRKALSLSGEPETKLPNH